MRKDLTTENKNLVVKARKLKLAVEVWTKSYLNACILMGVLM